MLYDDRNIMPIHFSNHAIKQLEKRGISHKLISRAVETPEEIISTYRMRKLRRIHHNGKLLEVVTKTEGPRISVVTGYYIKEKS